MARQNLLAFIAFYLIALTSVISYSVVNVYYQARVPSSGVKAKAKLGVYQDPACTLKLTSIEWGTIYPGGSSRRTGYVRNEGNVNVTLTTYPENWAPPEAAGEMTLTWNETGQNLTKGSVVYVQWNLLISTLISNVTNFSFDVVINGTG